MSESFLLCVFLCLLFLDLTKVTLRGWVGVVLVFKRKMKTYSYNDIFQPVSTCKNTAV